ncbi:hypothetical protein ACNS7O_18035 (plasmid) [Haloferacaceae archaeon DSL9]
MQRRPETKPHGSGSRIEGRSLLTVAPRERGRDECLENPDPSRRRDHVASVVGAAAATGEFDGVASIADERPGDDIEITIGEPGETVVVDDVDRVDLAAYEDDSTTFVEE